MTANFGDTPCQRSSSARIVSASRRTDIPAFYAEWLLNRLHEGYVLTQNPYNAKQIKHVSLLPQDVHCLVLWSKNPQPLLARTNELSSLGFPCLMHFSLLPYNTTWHPHLPPLDALVDTFCSFEQSWGKTGVIWRYDPIILNDVTTTAWHAEHFEQLCIKLQHVTDTVVISFVDSYRHLPQGLLRPVSEEAMYQTAAVLGTIASKYGLVAQTCCEAMDFSSVGVHQGACIDIRRIEMLSGQELHIIRDQNQRPLCGCAASVDIGMYNTCGHGCAYCYATRSTKSSERNVRAHNPYSALLIESSGMKPETSFE